MSLSRAGSSNTLSWRIISSAHDLFHSAQNFPIYAQKIRHGSFFLPCIFAIRIFFHFFPPTFLEKLVHTLFILFSELPSYISVETIKSYFFHVFKGRKFLKILWFSPYILMNQITLSKIFHMQLWFHSIALRYIRWKPSSENLIPFTKGSLMSERFSLWLHLQKKGQITILSTIQLKRRCSG